MRKSGKFVKCVTCAKEVYKPLWALKRSKSDKHFCSRPCSNKDPDKLSKEVKDRFSKLYTGIKFPEATRVKLSIAAKGRSKPWIQGCRHPRWKGGIYGYPWQFNKTLKDRIKLRDGSKCVLCQRTEESAKALDSLGRGLTIHHVDHNRKNNLELNLVTLCRSCNSKEMTNPAAYLDKILKIVNDIVRPSQKCEDSVRNEQSPCEHRE